MQGREELKQQPPHPALLRLDTFLAPHVVGGGCQQCRPPPSQHPIPGLPRESWVPLELGPSPSPGSRTVLCLVPELCPTLCNPMDCSPPGSSVHGVLQARVLEWVAISFSRGSSQSRDQSRVCCNSCLGRRIVLPLSHMGSLFLNISIYMILEGSHFLSYSEQFENCF